MAQFKDSATLADFENFVLGHISTMGHVPVTDQIALALKSSQAHVASLVAACPAFAKLVDAEAKYIKQRVVIRRLQLATLRIRRGKTRTLDGNKDPWAPNRLSTTSAPLGLRT
jgi:hypothetical protein